MEDVAGPVHGVFKEGETVLQRQNAWGLCLLGLS